MNHQNDSSLLKEPALIIEDLSRVVGKENIELKPDVLAAFSKDSSFVSSIKPACVVKVKNLEEVQKLVKLANEAQIPLIPVSSGAPHFRGDTVPGTGGAVIVDLSGMKRVIHISRKHRMVMFEPGVTFGELISAVAKEGLRLNIPLAPRKTKSVLGSLLEREPVTMPIYHWDIGDPSGCFEIVFGNGDLFRTGASAGSGTIEEQWAAGGSQKEAAGPSSASWYRLIQGAQGTMGIVTWGTARCEVMPKLEEPFFIGSPNLEKITDILHWLTRLRLANECLVLNDTNTAALLAENDNEFQKLKTGLPPWVLFFNIAAYDYFPEERIQGQIEDMNGVTQKLGVKAVKTLGKINAGEFLKTVQQPSADPYWKIRQNGACQDIFFITVYEKLAELIKTMHEAADKVGYPTSKIGTYLQPIVQGVNCHCEFNLFYNPQDVAETAKVKQLNAIATRSLMEKGAFFSRPYAENTSVIMNRDGATVAALRKIKQITDPNHIMNPGKLCF
jgi:FAD/FMN-containing dehydrogenase